MSVVIIGYKEIQKEEGKTLVFIEIQGELKMVQNQDGLFYMTADKTTILSSFPVEICKGLIGQKLPGNVERIEVEPYQYLNKDTGETITRKYKNVYMPEVIKGYDEFSMLKQTHIPYTMVGADLTKVMAQG